MRQFGKLITALRREGADPVRKGRPWSLPLEDQVLLIAAYWRTSLTMRQLAPLFGVSKSAADRIIDHLGPLLALQQRKRFRKDAVLLVDGTLAPTRDHSIAEQSKNYRYSTSHQVVIDADTRLVVAVGRPLPATATTARHGSCPARKTPSARPRSSRTAATRAPAWSSRTAANAARPNSRHGKRNATPPPARSAPASSTLSPV
ncbi:hypothetical protein HDA41_000115 [Streptomyces caelestis]|uniref:Transposase Helix-turn-helix domain-containing protein n=1 Tax=Streptomyces caelestis TaxID=36816 RepID=A0A7W9GYJ3_9ACTN|nr:hypothetical protein [Streptomyces caelestis]